MPVLSGLLRWREKVAGVSMTGGRGSNQYVKYLGGRAPGGREGLVGPGLMEQAGVPARRQCGDIWGDGCRCVVGPPHFAHGDHPSLEQQLRVLWGDGNEVALWVIARDGNPIYRRYVAKHRRCPPDVRALLATDPVDRVRWAAAQLMPDPPAVFDGLAVSDDMEVRHELAGSRCCPPEVLGVLAGDRSIDVRRAVAGNPRTPPEVLSRLSRERSYRVSNAVVSNPGTPAGALERLLRHRDGDVRKMAAEHPNLPVATRAMWELTRR
jgi:hypothetical protein